MDAAPPPNTRLGEEDTSLSLDNDSDNSASEIGTLAVALFEFAPEREDMLPFKSGDILTIIEMNKNGWWKGSNVRANLQSRVSTAGSMNLKITYEAAEGFRLYCFLKR